MYRVLVMYVRLLRKLGHTKMFSVTHRQPFGWDVNEEEDSRIVVTVRYRDWHRVERAIRTFAGKAASLREHGWTDHAVIDGPGRA